MSKIFITVLLLSLLTAQLIFAGFVLASSTDGTIDSTYKYAWGENIGWINFGTTNGNVHVTDSGLSGYALTENVGWINLDNVTNDGQGNLSGYAWGENVGWINFAPTNGGVIINSSGEFTGSALGENTGWIIFDCNYQVKTDWRSRSVRPQCNNSLDDDNDGKIDYPNDPGCSSLNDNNETDPGSGGDWAYNPLAPPAGGFKVLINNNNTLTNSRDVSLELTVGPDTKRMAISNNPDLKRGTGKISFQTPYSWDLCYQQKECPKGVYTVYVKFYTQWERGSKVISDSIILRTITIEELKEKINLLKSQIIQLQNQLKQLLEEKISEIPQDYIFNTDLQYGDENIQVRYLQLFLKSQGKDIYPEGIISGWFGPLTNKAVIRFQEKYASDILAPWGFTKGTGLVAKTTRAKINEILGH